MELNSQNSSSGFISFLFLVLLVFAVLSVFVGLICSSIYSPVRVPDVSAVAATETDTVVNANALATIPIPFAGKTTGGATYNNGIFYFPTTGFYSFSLYTEAHGTGVNINYSISLTTTINEIIRTIISFSGNATNTTSPNAVGTQSTVAKLLSGYYTLTSMTVFNNSSSNSCTFPGGKTYVNVALVSLA